MSRADAMRATIHSRSVFRLPLIGTLFFISQTFISFPSSASGFSIAMTSSPAATPATPAGWKTTQRSSAASMSAISDDSDALRDRTQAMNQRASSMQPFTVSELDGVLHSIQNVYPSDCDLDSDALRSLLSDVAHVSHKDWAVTGANSEKLQSILLPSMQTDAARQLCDRIRTEGNWDGAVEHRRDSSDGEPWAVLVTGVNGIRKTTSMYQDWFPDLLQEALVCPPTAGTDKDDAAIPTSSLPCGSNGFFRQLDHMIATLCNEDFLQLYALTAKKMGLSLQQSNNDDADATPQPPKEIVQSYSDLKAAIFTRYRTLSELFGVALLRHAQKESLNCMLETSGRDVAMFHYVDTFFPTNYRKLALHFQINDLTQAQTSVDARMVKEIQTGIVAMRSGDTKQIILANAGGPYGSEVLAGVQKASDQVWKDEVVSDNVGKDWYKATIQINAYGDQPWTAQAVCPDGTLGTVHPFVR